MSAARGTHPDHLVVVVRHHRDLVAEHVTDLDPDVLVADQDEVPGTGRAVECGLDRLPADLEGTVLVTYGDVPLLTSETLVALLEAHASRSVAVTVVTASLGRPHGLRPRPARPDGGVVAIVEQKDATPEQLAVAEVNSGLYAVRPRHPARVAGRRRLAQRSGEKYLTDVVGIAHARGLTVRAHPVDDVWQTEGVNYRVQLARLGAELNRRTLERVMRDGATVVDPRRRGSTQPSRSAPTPSSARTPRSTERARSAPTASIGPDTTLEDVEVGDGATIVRTQALLAVIGPGANVGPFSYLRPGTELGAKGKIGGFVETKNAQIAAGAKVPHLTYAGDVTIGEKANIGAGTIFANYDGVRKHHSSVGAGTFVGSNSVIVAPVDIAGNAYVAAGSAITDDVKDGDLAIARERQRNIEGWVERRQAKDRDTTEPTT